MVGITGNRVNNAEWFILLSSVGTIYRADSSTVSNRCATVQIPPKLRYLSDDQKWKHIKDEIRQLISLHGLAGIPESYKVTTYFGDDGNLYASCVFKNIDDAREVFSMYVEGF